MKYGSQNYELVKQAQQSLLHPTQNEQDARIVTALQQVHKEGRVFHILDHRPDQAEDVLSILVDDILVINFEISRSGLCPDLSEIEVLNIEQYYAKHGQKGSHRLNATLPFARKILEELE